MLSTALWKNNAYFFILGVDNVFYRIYLEDILLININERE